MSFRARFYGVVSALVFRLPKRLHRPIARLIVPPLQVILPTYWICHWEVTEEHKRDNFWNDGQFKAKGDTYEEARADARVYIENMQNVCGEVEFTVRRPYLWERF